MAGDKAKLGSQMKDFINLGKKIWQDKEVIDYDQLLDDKRDLEEKLEAKIQEFDAKVKEAADSQAAADARVAKAEADATERATKAEAEATARATKAEAEANDRVLRAEIKNEGLFEEFQKRFKEWDVATSKESNLESQVAELKEQLGSANAKIETTEASMKTLQDKLLSRQHALTEMEKELNLAKKELSSRIRELKGTLGELQSTQTQMEKHRVEIGLEYPLMEDLATNFSNLSGGCHKMAKKFFCTELPPELLTSELWKQLEASGFLKLAPRKLPMSNSMAARCLRMATAERIIADKLCADMFRQYYLPHSTPARELIDDITKRLNKKSPFKEAVFRLQLLAAYEHDENSFTASLVKYATEDVLKTLDPLLGALGVRDEFQMALAKLFEESVKLWKSVQRSATKAFVTNDPEYRGHDSNDQDSWDLNEEYDTAVGLTNEQMAQIPDQVEPIIPLFPQVSIGRNVICPGCALWSDQNSVVAAGIEYGQMNSRHSPQGRWMPRRDSERRRLSSSSPKKPEEISKPPLSPSAGYHSFLERADSRPASRRPSPPLRKATPPVSPPASPPPALQAIEVAE